MRRLSCIPFMLLTSSLFLYADKQVIFVLSDDFNATVATLQRYEKTRGAFEPVGAAVTVNLGRSGVGWGLGREEVAHRMGEPLKQEGDGRSPAGIFSLDSAFGYTSGFQTSMPYIQADAKLICVDDTDSSAYNTLITLDGSAPPKSFEWMKRDDDLYALGITVAHNTEQAYRGGSCIFLHIEKAVASPTSGCTSMSKDSLASIISWLDPQKDPLLVQIPKLYCDEIEKRFVGVRCLP